MSNGFRRRAVLSADRTLVAVEKYVDGEWALDDWAYVTTDPDTAIADLGFDRTTAWNGPFADLAHADQQAVA